MIRTRIAAPAAIAALTALALSFNPLPTEATSSKASAPSQAVSAYETAIFAGGCFWCVESDFDHVNGVVKTTSGYMGGNSENATYKTHTQFGHREVVAIEFDPKVTSFEALLDVFFHATDPTDIGGQFCDRGFSYSTAVYALNDEQLAAAEEAKVNAAAELNTEIATEVLAASPFWAAETYHQDYYQKNPIRYKGYRYACGRDKSVTELWGDEARRGIEAH